MDLVVRNARTAAHGDRLVDIGIAGGRIAAIEAQLVTGGESMDVAGCLVSPGLVESHVHLDKADILDRCRAETGDLVEAIAEVARAKRDFTTEDVYTRAARTLERCIGHGVTHLRTHVEVDPTIGLRGFEGVSRLVADYRWAVDIEICVFPQEGLLNNPGTDELMVSALQAGAHVVGGAPYTDSDPHGQIDRIFELARAFDVDIDLHLDFAVDPDDLDLLYVCRLTERHDYGGRVTIGHVSKLSAVAPEVFTACAKRLAAAGVALTVLPCTDLYLMGRPATHNVVRGVTPAHRLLHHGVTCALSTNNILNPFTPFGDGALIRQANTYAHICQVGSTADTGACLAMITTEPARLMKLRDYGLQVGCAADLVVLDATSPARAIAENAPVLAAFKRGRRTVTRPRPTLHRPA